ncbi:MAG: hypothetical protein NVS4B3_20070 [Gemmatimonadaceae bacterium]
MTLTNARRGFTLIEIMMVVVLMAIMMAIAFPKLQSLNRSTDVRSAAQQLATSVSAARGAAIRRGRHAYFNQSGSQIWVTVDGQSSVPDTTLLPADLSAVYGVTIVSPATTTIDFDPRGIGNKTNTSATWITYMLSKGSATDSVCVSKLGDVRRGCSL